MQTTNDILLIEDSPSQAVHLRIILEQLGYVVRLAIDGRTGWLEACHQHPLLILLDMNLPSMNGLQVLARLKRDQSTSTIPVVILSDTENIVQVEEALNLGASDYLFKGDCLRYHASEQINNSINQVLHESEVFAN